MSSEENKAKKSFLFLSISIVFCLVSIANANDGSTVWHVSADPAIIDHADDTVEGSLAWVAAQTDDGDTILLPAATTLSIGASIVFTKAIHMNGQGATLELAPGAAAEGWVRMIHLQGQEDRSLVGVTLENINLKGANPDDLSLGIRAERCHNLTIRDVYVSHVDSGITGQHVTGWTIERVTIENYTTWGIVPTDSEDIIATDIEIKVRDSGARETGSAFEFKRSSHGVLQDSVIYGASGHGVNIRAADGAHCEHILILRVRIESTPKNGVYIHVDDPESSLTNVLVQDVEVYDANWWGVVARASYWAKDQSAILSSVTLSNIEVDGGGSGGGIQLVRSRLVNLASLILSRVNGSGLQLLSVLDVQGKASFTLNDCGSTSSPAVKIGAMDIPSKNIKIGKKLFLRLDRLSPTDKIAVEVEPSSSDVKIKGILEGYKAREALLCPIIKLSKFSDQESVKFHCDVR